jgi:hypothetical protein
MEDPNAVMRKNPYVVIEKYADDVAGSSRGTRGPKPPREI